MTSKHDVEVLADKLSEAQGAFVRSIAFGGWWRPDEGTRSGIVGPLTKLGVLEVVHWQDVGNQYRITERGAALRSHLIGTGNG